MSWEEKVIADGDYQVLDKEAKRIGEALATKEATKTQVRSLFGTVKQIEFLRGDARRRALAMLRPRLAYAAARARELAPLRDALTNASVLTEKDPEKRAQRFIDLMEAIHCYSTAAR